MEIDKKELTETIFKTELLIADIELLKNGDWQTDIHSCNASIDNLNDILEFLKKLKK